MSDRRLHGWERGGVSQYKCTAAPTHSTFVGVFLLDRCEEIPGQALPVGAYNTNRADGQSYKPPTVDSQQVEQIQPRIVSAYRYSTAAPLSLDQEWWFSASRWGPLASQYRRRNTK